MMWDVQKLLGQLPQPVVTILRQATPTLLEQMTEIRLRSGQPLVVTVGERTLFLSKSGTVVPAEQGFIIPQELVQETMLSLCGHSLHGIEKTLEQGFFYSAGRVSYWGVHAALCCAAGTGAVALHSIAKGSYWGGI